MLGTENMWMIPHVTIPGFKMGLKHFSFRKEKGAENMATDMWLLEKTEQWNCMTFRRYGWAVPQLSFGYGQKASWVEKETGQNLSQIIRRPTGGGIVRHGNDLTYCMTLPRGSIGEQMAPIEFYGLLHKRWGEALDEQNISSALMPCPEKSKAGIPGDCFKEPVGRDLMDQSGQKKLGGAAMKRTRKGVLIQGTLELSDWPNMDHGIIEKKFITLIAADLEESISPADWPDALAEERLSWLTIYESIHWKKDRKST